jgi:signal transduction histidine kinase
VQENIAMVTRPRQSSVRDALWRGLPVLLTALLALGQVFAVGSIEGQETATLYGWLPDDVVLTQSGLFVLAQAAILLARQRFPLAVLVVVTALYACILLVSSGEIGTGTFAVVVAAYGYARKTTAPTRYVVVGGLAVAASVISVIALQTSTEVPPEWALLFSLARDLLTFGSAVVIAEIVDGRARLLDALRERVDAAERERELRAEEAVLRERALMARELHDIAAHHLTGIIVSAQAADALRLTDPETAGEYIRQVQKDARTTLRNLSQTVGLLRADAAGELAPVASIDSLPDLVAEATSVGTAVTLDETGTPRDLGPLAGIAAYRMVQESLANSLKHAAGAARAVRVEYGNTFVRLTVSNGPVPVTRQHRDWNREGYGLVGMAERAELLGATLRTGRSPDGGWVNTLLIPYDGEPT